MLSEADLIAKRAALRWLVPQYPEWTHQELADALDMSRAWVSKWLRRIRQADPADVLALHSRSRARHTPPASIDSQPAVVQRILEIRVAPPENLQRVPGPEAILYYLHHDPALKQAGVRLPRCASHHLEDSTSGRLYRTGSSAQAQTLRTATTRGRSPVRSKRCQ